MTSPESHRCRRADDCSSSLAGFEASDRCEHISQEAAMDTVNAEAGEPRLLRRPLGAA